MCAMSKVVGISGATCGGKTTILKWLQSIFRSSTVLNQDLYYFPVDDKRHIFCKGLNHINWEVVSAFDNSKLCQDVKSASVKYDRQAIQQSARHLLQEFDSISEKEIIQTKSGEEDSLKQDFIDFFRPLWDLPITFVEGITIFNYTELAQLCDLKFFVSLNHETCWARRQLRSYDPPDIEGYFDQVVWPSYLQIQEEICSKYQDSTVILDGQNELPTLFKIVLKGILQNLDH